MMELKQYQKRVISTLQDFLQCMDETNDAPSAYDLFWQRNYGLRVGNQPSDIPTYKDSLNDNHVPSVCFKVPTGGGKTFLACNALKPIFEVMPDEKWKVVVWLVPSDTILQQTVKSLKDPEHPYRQQLNHHFGGRVEVYTKETLLQGQNFSPSAISGQLSVMILSFDSFRTSRKDGRLAYRENSALMPFKSFLEQTEKPIDGTDDTALFQIINQLNPVVIIDESHHATTKLSIEMLKHFNPCFVLELTATPKLTSNVIAYVDALELKQEKMVKLPVILYNRRKTSDVIAGAISLRKKLEQLAEKGTQYLRPIILFQAQPRTKENKVTFEKLKQKLIDSGIPEHEIAIKTAEVDELKNIDLLSKECPIRYIITVNALKEGWDCPFAYILASLANKSSAVDVEQILGRILRLPYTREQDHQANNLAYVLTSSNDFNETIQNVIKGLNNAGFSEKDYRADENAYKALDTIQPQIQPQLPLDNTADETTSPSTETVLDETETDFKPEEVRNRLEKEAQTEEQVVEQMLQYGMTQAQQSETTDTIWTGLPTPIKDSMKKYPIKEEFHAYLNEFDLPMFAVEEEKGLFFGSGPLQKLEPSHLMEDFTLAGKDATLNTLQNAQNIVSIDITKKNSKAHWSSLNDKQKKVLMDMISSSETVEQKRRRCKNLVLGIVKKIDAVSDREISDYLDNVIRNLNPIQLETLENEPEVFAVQFKEKVQFLIKEHQNKKFAEMLNAGTIKMAPLYKLPDYFIGQQWDESADKSLYTGEEPCNGLEQKLIHYLTSIDSIEWWHRNPAKGKQQGFYINGAIANHYPDFIVKTKGGMILLIETKGEQLKGNEDTQYKIKLGQTWASHAGNQFRYFMVFENEVPTSSIDGVLSLNGLVKVLNQME